MKFTRLPPGSSLAANRHALRRPAASLSGIESRTDSSRSTIAPASLLRSIVALALLASVTFAGCTAATEPAGDDEPARAANTPSAAFFDIPESLTGGTAPSSSLRAITVGTGVEGQIAATVEGYYAMVRDQVRFGADVAESVRELLAAIEETKFGDTYLLDWETDVPPSEGSDGYYAWTIITPDSEWKLEKWQGEVSIATKEFELVFEKSGDAYAGYVILNGDLSFERDETDAEVMPETMSIDFDSGIAVPGTSTLTLTLHNFRSIADIQGTAEAPAPDGDLESAIIRLSKDTATGAVSLASSIMVPNTRHFVWDGYLADPAGGADILNPEADAETRFYCATGISSGGTDDLATVSLGLPETYADPAASEAFSDSNALGPVIAQLITDRLNNNYDFEGNTGSDDDDGHEIMESLRNLQVLSEVNGYDGEFLDNSSWGGEVWTNTSAEIVSALTTLQDFIAEFGTDADQDSLDNVAYLLGVMDVKNPAYFNSLDFAGHTAEPSDAAWPALADLSVDLPIQDAVEALADAGIDFPVAE